MTLRYLTAQQATDFLGLPSVGALRAFLYRRRKKGFPVPTYRLGRNLRFKQLDLENALSVEASRTLRRVA